MSMCGNCRFVVKRDWDNGMTNGTTCYCRRYPKEIKTDKNYWCGEYKIVENS